jgi:predicted nucleic acid-binding protein
MNVIDSSAWIAYLMDDTQAATFADPIQALEKMLVPAVTISEVFRFVARHHNRQTALNAVSYMRRGRVAPLDAGLAVQAAICGLKFKLPLADSIIYATTQKFAATLWTQDSDFEGLPNVKYFPG